MGKMSEIGQVGRTILLVSHRLNVLKALCPKTILIMDGQIKAFGESEEVIEKYY